MHCYFAWNYPDGRKAVRFDDAEKREILSLNRYKIVALLDFFSWRLDRQYKNPAACFHGFYVEEPKII